MRGSHHAIDRLFRCVTSTADCFREEQEFLRGESQRGPSFTDLFTAHVSPLLHTAVQLGVVFFVLFISSTQESDAGKATASGHARFG